MSKHVYQLPAIQTQQNIFWVTVIKEEKPPINISSNYILFDYIFNSDPLFYK